MDRPKAFVFDVDGTLIQFTPELRAHLAADRLDLATYHAAAVTEAPVSSAVLVLLEALQRAGVAIIMSTYRHAAYRQDTLDLFDRIGISPDKTYMRLPEDSDLPNYVVKAKHLDRIEETFDVVGVADDDPAIEELCKRRGIPVLVVPGWVEAENTTNARVGAS